MITIRDRDMHPVAKGPAQREITRRAETVAVDRVDVYPHPEGPALLGVAWTDGSTGVCDWADARACLDWVRLQPWAANVTHVHYRRGAAA